MSEQERSEWSNDLRNKYGIAQPEANECDWQVWPETDGLEQRCMVCGKYRKTP